MFLSRKHVALLASMALAAASAVPSGAAADTSESGPGVLQEIVVTAQKREQNMQDVGTSITAFDAKQIENLRLTDATDLVEHVPGLQFNWFGPSLLVYNLRGVSQNDYGDHQEAPVAVYSDEAYIGAMGALAGSLYDLERVEVLRGPQGTLFGRNATGGLIQYLSRPPTDTLDGYLQVTGGRYVSGSDAAGFNAEGAIGGPLTDNLSARLSFAVNKQAGIIENRIAEDIQDANQYAARLQFLLKPSDSMRLLLKLYEHRNIHEVPGDYSWTAAYPNAQGLGQVLPPDLNYWGGCPGCDLDGYRNPSTNVFNQAVSTPGYFDRTVYGATARLTWDLSGSTTLTSVTDYQHMEKDYYEHSNPSPISPIFFGTAQTYWQFSQELRLNGQAEHFRWITGLYYLDRSSQDKVLSVFGGTFTVPPIENASNQNQLSTKSVAGFGQVEWDATADWTLTAGLRYTHDKIRYDYTLYNILQDGTSVPSLFFNPSTDPDLAERSFNLVSGKLEADYKGIRDLLLYASISRGVKGGGYSAPSFNTSVFGLPPLTVDRLTYNPERLTSYEVGEKWIFLSGHARLNSAAFYYNYKDYQGITSVNFLNTVGNYQAYIKGGEVELEIAPVKGLDLQLGVSYLSATVQNVPLPNGVLADRWMPQAPRWSVVALARYQWAAGAGQLYAQTDWKFNSTSYFTILNNPTDFEPEQLWGNVQFGYTIGNWDIAAICRNVSNRLYRVYNSDASGFGFAQPVFAPPRWVGMTATYRF